MPIYSLKYLMSFAHVLFRLLIYNSFYHEGIFWLTYPSTDSFTLLIYKISQALSGKELKKHGAKRIHKQLFKTPQDLVHEKINTNERYCKNTKKINNLMYIVAEFYNIFHFKSRSG